MFLKKLTVKGFKTFADGINLEFNSSGITAIVGPNGCGKSNIVDAFRFALGESALRDLRVSNLPEVIFAGTAARKPLSLAETSLFFDNSQRYLPIEYSEVMVRRRTYRDGESEFYINGQSARLKDIRGLFLDTGLSADSLCIIGQGKVDAVLSSRPEERRAFFEEAVGINKYRTRKVEAEKKLIMAEQNLLRISDLKVEIGEQKIGLEDQAAKALEYKTWLQKLKDLELGLYKKQVESLFRKKALLEEDISRLSELEKQHQHQEEEKSQERQKLGGELQALEQEIDRRQAELEELKTGHKLEHERGLFAQRTRIRDLKEEIRFLEFEIKKADDTVGQIDKNSQEITEKIREVETPQLESYGLLKATLQEVERLVKQAGSLVAQFGYQPYHALSPQATEDRLLKMLQEEQAKKAVEKKNLKQVWEKKIQQKAELLSRVAELEAMLLQAESLPQAPVEGVPSLEAALEADRKKRMSLLEKLEKTEDPAQRSPEYAVRDELSAARISLVKVEAELSYVLERALSEYSVSCQELLAAPALSEALPKARAEADQVRVRMRELEPVNLLAIEEFKKIKERHVFIEEQHADLSGAVQNLRDLIRELDHKAREDFAAGMKVVSENFCQIFGELFIGGEARIELEKDQDLLEAGIEIAVCPSGRKWLNLSLLSGGERALTAIAILFAVLKTSPSPLCVLDEVDAPLDDANVVRFANFLKNYSVETQIVVITHNKQTMAVADSIYGVTMEEAGISKVISLAMEKV